MVMAQQAGPALTYAQYPAPAVQQYPAPYAPVSASQAIDITSIVNMIVPIFMLMMLFGMLKPMMSGFGGD